jgi:hypothetical protein
MRTVYLVVEIDTLEYTKPYYGSALLELGPKRAEQKVLQEMLNKSPISEYLRINNLEWRFSSFFDAIAFEGITDEQLVGLKLAGGHDRVFTSDEVGETQME